RNAFLYVDDINKTPLNIGDVEITQGRSGWTINEKISKGDDALVQIVKEPRGLKGARISTNISLPGRYLILMPTGRYSGVSRKIESAEERNRLKTIMKMIRPPEMATVVRTAAAGVSQSELIADLGVLIRMWHGILESYKRAQAPALIHKDMNLVFKAARDFITPEVDRVLIDDAEDFEKVRDFMRLLGPQYVDRIEYYNGGRSLFKDFHIDDEVQKLLRPKINLASGGSIVIESTEALTVIDVNSGKFTGGRNLEETIVKTNVEAAAEIARQVRLRDIGGIIVCDFIDMSSEASRTRVIETLKAGLVRDRTRTTIQSFSALGLLEFTRKRVGKDLSAQLRGACPTCKGLGTVMSPESVAIDAFRDVRRFGHAHGNGATGHKPIEVVSAPTVGAQIEYWYEDELAGLERELETTIAVRVDPALHPEKTRICELPDEAAANAPPPSVRVGDELEATLVSARLPVATSALALVGDRLVEVENAAGAASDTLRIKVIDIDEDGTILAEPRGPVALPAAETRKRRRRGGRGRRKPLETPAEQEEELRQLAEEAAKGIGGRPGLGISTAAEAEAEDAESRAHKPTAPALATVTPIRPVPDYASVDAAGEGRTFATYGGPGDEGRKRRRRRRRRRPGAAEALPAAGSEVAAAPPVSGTLPVDASLLGQAMEEDDDETAPAAAGVGDEGQVRRRRRRRRRRGRGQLPAETVGSAGQAVPDRQIFRVDGSGAAEPTGETAPPQPSRAITPLERKAAPPAIDAPPPSLTIPEVAAEVAKVAKPARRRRTRTETEPADFTVGQTALLPGTEPAEATPAEPAVAVRKRGRPRKVDVAATSAAAEAAPPAPAAPARTLAATTRKVTAKKSAATKKTPAAKKTAGTAKKTTAKKAPAARKTTAKKSTATRRKTT
ncbi:MAG: Rne/Rng family ribonuclease, partial [Candidatus Eremiobacteraeota bacterium]|nr:Rne/Rng family ribonuclease [Candidatus Eremiobacteraeota bacterium]